VSDGSGSDGSCRADVWLWRARLCKTRTLATRLVESGRIRLNRPTGAGRLDKPSRPLRPGDELVFALGGRLTAIRIVALGVRRGPVAEARALYAPLAGEPERLEADSDVDSECRNVTDAADGPPRH
jgi:ribosomal 50S subunit-recycling heat shock protein